MSDPAFVLLSNGRRIYFSRGEPRGEALRRTGGQLNPQSHRLWRRLVEEGDWTTVVDVGANYGEMLAGIEFSENTRIIAVEPNAGLHASLRRTFHEAELSVSLVEEAISDAVGEADFVVSTSWSGWSRLGGVEGTPIEKWETHRIKTTTLDALLAGSDLKQERLLLKIDVEGQEMAVLRGGRGVFSTVAGYAVMIEIENLPSIALANLTRRFRVQLLSTVGELIEIAAGDIANRGCGSFHWTDAVLRARDP